jgi:hypothetical protein
MLQYKLSRAPGLMHSGAVHCKTGWRAAEDHDFKDCPETTLWLLLERRR